MMETRYFNAALFALGLVFLMAAASSDDRELIATWPDGTELRVCAKPAIPGVGDPCYAAMAGRWQPLGYPPIEQSVMRCVVHPRCFEDRSNCINGFNCEGK